MSNVVTSYRFWIPGNHRHHHSFDGGNEVPDKPTHEADGTTWVSDTATDNQYGQFLFWSVTGGRDHGLTSESRPYAAGFPLGTAEGLFTAWYRAIGPEMPPAPPGVTFDAFSADTGDFLDWGDGIDPFTVEPGSDRNDSFATTETGGVVVTAARGWPAPDTALIFDQWLCFGIPDVPGPTITASQGRSAWCLAVYASPLGPRPPRPPWPPEILLVGDPAEFTREVAGYLSVCEQAKGLADVAATMAIREQALTFLAARVDSELKSISGTE